MESGRKLRIYLDTSVISNLFADDAPSQMEGSNLLWEKCMLGAYDVFVSALVFDELDNCPEPKRGRLFERLRLIRFQTLLKTKDVDDLAAEYVKKGVLKEKHIADCYHIAYAVAHGCDVIVSWNFEHLVNEKTKGRVKIVNATNRYREIGIVSPDLLLEGVWK